MKTDVIFLPYSEFIQRCDIIKRRQERLIQVRQQSNEMAATLIERMKSEAEKQYEDTEKHILNEIWEQHSKELTAMRRVYEECILNINQEHYNKPITKSTAPSGRNVGMLVPGEGKLRECNPKCLSTSSQNRDTKKSGASKDTGSHAPPVPNQLVSKPSCSIPSEQNKSALKNTKKPDLLMKPTHREFVKSCTRSSAQNRNPVKKSNFTPVRTIISSRCFRELIHKSRDKNINKDIVIISPEAKSPSVEHEKEDYLNSYTSQVHDRIRILEQKEKILQRRIPTLSDKSNLTETVIPKRTLENYLNPNTQNRVVPKTDIASNLTAENNVSRSSDPTTEKRSSNDEPKKTLPPVTTKSISISSSSISEDATSKTKTSPQKTPPKAHLPRPCKKRRRRCKHTNLYKDEDVVIVVRNHRNGVTITKDDKLTAENTSTRSYVQESIPRRKNSRVTLDISNAENKIRRIRQLLNECDSRVPAKEISHKLRNWRKLFSNGEKLSESSYLSPPTSFHKDEKLTTRCKKKESKTRTAAVDVAEDKSENDLGYYVAKLLLMSPEGLENLNSISDDTITTISTGLQEEKEEMVYSSDGDQTDDEERQLPGPRDQSTNDSESIDEEEFIRRMLEVKLPSKSATDSNVKTAEPSTIAGTKVNFARPKPQVAFKNASSLMSETDGASKVPIVVHSSNGGNNRSSESSRSSDVFLKETPKTNLRLERLSNWIGTSIRRTLEAATFNSTSSYDENDSYRQVNQLAQSLLERREYLLSSETSSTSRKLSFSPIKVPDVHLSVPQISGTSS